MRREVWEGCVEKRGRRLERGEMWGSDVSMRMQITIEWSVLERKVRVRACKRRQGTSKGDG